MLVIDLAKALGATLWVPPSLSETTEAGGINPDQTEIHRVAPIASALPGEITFLAQEAYAPFLKTTRASVVIVALPQVDVPILQLIHPSPYRAFAQVAQLFINRQRPAAGIRPGAFIADDADIHPSAIVMPQVSIGAKVKIEAGVWLYPGVYVGDGAVIGAGTEVRANVVIEHGVVIGQRCLIHGGSVIGADGFGFAPSPEGHLKIPQVGRVVIHDDVEVGALCTIDRGALEDTVVGRGTKLDSHVHIGHGVVIGEHCILCGFTGIAGSAKLGNWVVTGGHSAINNRCVLADRVQVGAMSALTKSAPVQDTYLGFPAIPAKEWRRQVAAGRRGSELEKRVRELEKHRSDLTKNETSKKT